MIGAAVAAALLVLVLVAGQLVLPGIAERRLKDDLQSVGTQPQVQVSAFPAVKLLFHKADKVTVRFATARTEGGTSLADELERTQDAGKLDVRVGTLEVGALVIRDARLRKRSGGLTAIGSIRNADLAAVLPPLLQQTRASRQQDGDGLLLDGTVAVPLLGTIQAQARVTTENGTIVTRAENLPVPALTIFQDPRVSVRSLTSRRRANGFELTATGTITG